MSGLNDALLELKHLSEAFPNLVRLIKIAMTIAVSTAQCERSFSTLKLVKNHLRSTMGDERLSNLAVLSIESELSDAINLEEVILNFLDWITIEGLLLFKLVLIYSYLQLGLCFPFTFFRIADHVECHNDVIIIIK